MNIELIYDEDCPNAEGARALIRRVLQNSGLKETQWMEHCRQEENAPAYAQDYGSPTILVNGKDVAPSDGAGGNACRIYRDSAGRMSGLPPEERIVSALGTAVTGGSRTTLFTSSLAGLFGMLPVLTCAGCWPAYTAFLSTMGFGFLNYTPFVLPLMIVLSAIALFGLFFRANTRHGFGPFLLGLGATAVIIAGRFWLEHDLLLYTGAGMFILASGWNAWPRKVNEIACDC